MLSLLEHSFTVLPHLSLQIPLQLLEHSFTCSPISACRFLLRWKSLLLLHLRLLSFIRTAPALFIQLTCKFHHQSQTQSRPGLLPAPPSSPSPFLLKLPCKPPWFAFCPSPSPSLPFLCPVKAHTINISSLCFFSRAISALLLYFFSCSPHCHHTLHPLRLHSLINSLHLSLFSSLVTTCKHINPHNHILNPSLLQSPIQPNL